MENDYNERELSIIQLQGDIAQAKIKLNRLWNRSKWQLPDASIVELEREVCELINQYSLLVSAYSRDGGTVKFCSPAVVGSSYII